MASATNITYESWVDQDVYDTSGDKVGGVDHIVYDSMTQRPEFMAVKTGLFGHKTTFVPISGSQAENGSLVVPWKKDFIKDAPKVEGDDWELSKADEARLFSHYGLDHETQPYGETNRADTDFVVGSQPSTGARIRRYQTN